MSINLCIILDFCTEPLNVRYVEWNGLAANASPLLSLTRRRHRSGPDCIQPSLTSKTVCSRHGIIAIGRQPSEERQMPATIGRERF